MTTPHNNHSTCELCIWSMALIQVHAGNGFEQPLGCACLGVAKCLFWGRLLHLPAVLLAALTQPPVCFPIRHHAMPLWRLWDFVKPGKHIWYTEHICLSIILLMLQSGSHAVSCYHWAIGFRTQQGTAHQINMKCDNIHLTDWSIWKGCDPLPSTSKLQSAFGLWRNFASC